MKPARARADAVGPCPVLVEGQGQQDAGDLQRSCETVQEKPFFRAAFGRTRCLIPISGYFEWKTTQTQEVIQEMRHVS